MVALAGEPGQRVDLAAANLVLAGDVDVRSGAADLLDGLGQPQVEGPLALGRRQVEIGDLDGAGNGDRLGHYRSGGEGEKGGNEDLGHVASPNCGSRTIPARPFIYTDK